MPTDPNYNILRNYLASVHDDSREPYLFVKRVKKGYVLKWEIATMLNLRAGTLNSIIPLSLLCLTNSGSVESP
jgi:hypothetical protein